MRRLIAEELRKTAALIAAIADDAATVALVESISACCVAALRGGNKLLLAGNGGSAGDAQHLAAEFVSRFNFDRPGLSAFALTTDSSTLTAIGNDYGYEQLFARQIQAVGHKDDVFFGLSTSGRSPNVLRALEECRRIGIVTIGMTGQHGGEMPPLCDYCLCVPSTETPKIQEAHITLGHIVCNLVEREMFAPS